MLWGVFALFGAHCPSTPSVQGSSIFVLNTRALLQIFTKTHWTCTIYVSEGYQGIVKKLKEKCSENVEKNCDIGNKHNPHKKDSK
jgi:hypothetical protein